MPIVFDIGCGQALWSFYQRSEGAEVLYPRGVPKGTFYIGLDILYSELVRVRNVLQTNKELSTLAKGNVELVNTDGTLLPFRSEVCDLVVLSDVLSNPTHDWCLGDGCDFTGEYFEDDGDYNSYCCECHKEPQPYRVGRVCGCEVFRGCSGKTKWAIITEAQRVLRYCGKL